MKREIQVIDFWESYQKQKRLKSYLISHILAKKPPISGYSDRVSEEVKGYGESENIVFKKRNEIAQKILELAYHIYGK